MSSGRIPGSFRIASQRIASQRRFELYADPWLIGSERRIGRILASIERDIDEGGVCRVRQILKNPRELYRLELERPDMSYERTTILDRETLTALLEQLPEAMVRDSFFFRS